MLATVVQGSRSLLELLHREVFSRIPPKEELEDVRLMTKCGSGELGDTSAQQCHSTLLELQRILKHMFGCNRLGRISAGAQTALQCSLFLQSSGVILTSSSMEIRTVSIPVFLKCSGQDVCYATWLLIRQRSKAGVPVSTRSMTRCGSEGHGGEGLTVDLDDLRNVFRP